jgi:hypothetical protein
VQGPTDFDDEVERELAKRLSQSAAWSVQWENRLLQEVIQRGTKLTVITGKILEFQI